MHAQQGLWEEVRAQATFGALLSTRRAHYAKQHPDGDLREASSLNTHSLIPRFCRADLGSISCLGLANFRKIACRFLSACLQRISSAKFARKFFGLLSPGSEAPPRNSRPKLSAFFSNFTCLNPTFFHSNLLLMGEKTPTPKTRFSIWTLLRTPGRFTTRPLPVDFTTKCL